ncbi:12801_t:CDS:2, partial [Racocetra persica]
MAPSKQLNKKNKCSFSNSNESPSLSSSQSQQPGITQSFNNVNVSKKSTFQTANSLTNINKLSYKYHKEVVISSYSSGFESDYHDEQLSKKRKSYKKNYKKTIGSGNTSSSETDELSSQQVQKKRKHKKKYMNTTLSDSESETKKNAMREFIAQIWTSNIPEYRKLSSTKIRSLVKKYKANNPDFPECINDWAIKMMMHRSINQQRKKEHDATKNNNDTRITEKETMVLSDDDYLDRSELATERVE